MDTTPGTTPGTTPNIDPDQVRTIPTTMIPTDRLVQNTGQLDFLPSNPRRISPSKLRRLAQSMRDYPGMIYLRELIVLPVPRRGRYVVIAGNMRLQAARQIGLEALPCKVLPEDTTPEEVRAYALRDNSHFGEWVTELQEWPPTELELAQVPIPAPDFEALQDAMRHTAAWRATREAKAAREAAALHGADGEAPTGTDGHTTGTGLLSIDTQAPTSTGTDEPLCDLRPRPAVYLRSDFAFAATFKTGTAEGVPLSEIKTPSNVSTFSAAAEQMTRRMAQLRAPEGWALLTTPARRHTEQNFAEAVCAELADRLRVHYYPRFATSRNRDRVKPVFTATAEVMEPNVIIYDDILTTGSSIRATMDLLPRKNVLVVVGINNN